ncbi:SGNH hydrolase domain-containing protein, partial [Nocardia lijiangensis]|uniref:SGNH hydrolase domain-containing protein n=1 Tax=Nocardia lijiangensis TaxID=299618 RepID=UPI000AA5BCA7
AAVPRATMRPTVFEAPADGAYPSRDKCIADWDTREVITCTYGDAGAERTIAVVGSSHAEHWVPALDVLAREHGFRLTVYLKMGCPLTVAAEPMYKGEPIPDCRDWSAEVIDRLGVDRPQWVFTTGTRPRDGTGDETPTDYLEVWSRLAEHGLNVLAVRDTPWLRRDGVRYRAIDCLAQSGDGVSCGMRRVDALDEVNPAAEPAASFPNVFPLDLTDAVCTPEVCPVIEGNILVYHDEHHLTASYSRSLAPELGRRLAPILGWW